MGVADLMASVANAPPVADDGADEETTEEAPPVEGEEAPAEETEEEPEADPEEAEKAALRQADYTKKTQALAEERKQLHAEIEKERAAFAKEKEDWSETEEWLRGLNDPDQAEYQLMRFFPKTVAALRDKWISEAGEESQLSERERAALRRVRELEVEKRARTEEETAMKKRHEKAKKEQATLELRKKLDAWLPAAAKACGLDSDEDTFRLIRNELSNGSYWDKQWSQDVISAAAKAVAKAMKRGEPLAPEAPKMPPSLKGPGAKAPPSAKSEKKAPPKRDLDNGFKSIREKYGL